MQADASFLDGLTVLITGGTGSFGRTILDRLVGTNVGCIRVFSRDEAKQDAMRDLYADRVEFVTGDVRDAQSVEEAMRGCDYVFHAAALKQVPNCERFPMEAVKTNVLGAANVVRAAKTCGVLALVAISTDKAVEPLNTMGLTKALMERIVLGGEKRPCRMLAVRYGNVVGSRGSVVPLFLNRISRGLPLPVTHPEMTRFLLCLQDAADLVIEAAHIGRGCELWVRKMPAATVQTIAAACQKLKGSNLPVEEIGIRSGEKMHEVLVSQDEMRRADERPDHFVIGAEHVEEQTYRHFEYTSANTDRLDVDAVVALLRKAGLG